MPEQFAEVEYSKDVGVLKTSKLLFGRFMLPDQSEHTCNCSNLTVDAAELNGAPVPAYGQTIILYLEHLGRLVCIAKEATERGFRVEFSLTGSRRERFLSRLDWVCKQENKEEKNERNYNRRELSDTQSHIRLPDGRTYPCEVSDISLTGAAIVTSVLPALGSKVYVGKMLGEVVRYVENGLAIRFLTGFGSDLLADIVEKQQD